MKIFLIAVFIALTFVSCKTAYQPSGYSGGYSETQLDENVFQVAFSGNAFTDMQTAVDYTLLRSAELAHQHGYKYFVLVDSQSRTANYQHTTPTQSQTNIYANKVGNSIYGTANTTTYGGHTYNVSKPSARNTIICLHEKPENYFAYNAEFIIKSIKTKHNIE